MFSADVHNGIITILPPTAVGAEVVARYNGFTINEWFYIVAMLCMVVSTVGTTFFGKRKGKDG